MSHFRPVQKPKPCLFLIGPEGSRKTTVAMTAPGPIYVIGTEEGHEEDTIWRHRGDKEVLIAQINREPADAYPQVWFGAYRGMWEQINAALDEVCGMEAGTVVIDSGSDIFGMAAARFNLVMERGEKPIPPLAYTQVYPLLRDLIAKIRGVHNVVLTFRLKDEYQNKEATGRQVMAAWNSAEYIADHIAWLEVEKQTGLLFAHGTKGVIDGSIVVAPTWDKMIESGVWFGNDDSEVYRLATSLKKAYSFLEARNIEFERRSLVNPSKEELSSYVAELRQTAKDATKSKASTNGQAA